MYNLREKKKKNKKEEKLQVKINFTNNRNYKFQNYY